MAILKVGCLDQKRPKSEYSSLMYLNLPTWLNLADETQKVRNDIIRIGLVAFILGFELIATWLILRDRVSKKKQTSNTDTLTSEVPSNPTTTPNTSPTQHRPWMVGVLSLIYSVLLTAGVILFPYCFEKGWYGLLIPAAFVIGAVFYSRETKFHRLTLTPPARPALSDLAGLLLITCVTFGLILLNWETIPTGMNGDVATICMSGMRMWTAHLHPLRMNSSTLPGLLDPLYGGGVLLTGSPFFGNRLYPLFCGILCPIVIYRWVRLIGSRDMAWFTTIVMIATPFFQYYSRVPMGTSLWLMELVFFYGLTRSLVTSGARGPLLAGIALALAQWDYYSSRTLVALALAAPFLAWPFRKRLAHGWWWRLSIIPLFGIGSLLAFPLMVNYGSREWTFYYSPAFFSVQNSDLAHNPSLLGIKLLGHLQMWFSPTFNEARFMTVPASPVMFGSFAGLLLVGFGIGLYSLFSSMGFLLASIFILGIACSLASMGAPNGHRGMTATLPVLLMVGLGLSALWPSRPVPSDSTPDDVRESDSNTMGFTGWLRRLIVLTLLVWGCWASLGYFQTGMWKDQRTIRAQEYNENLRPMRVREDSKEYDVVIIPPPKDIDRFITESFQFTVLDYGKWLPPNWAKRPLAVHGTVHVHSLAGLVNSLAPWLQAREITDPANFPAGWEYKTGREKINSFMAAKQWSQSGKITGTLMFPQPGRVELTCTDYLIRMNAPIASTMTEGKTEVQVLRGLNRLTFRPTRVNQPLPQTFHLTYRPDSGKPQGWTLAPTDLYAIPLCGWLQTVVETGFKDQPAQTKKTVSVTPTLFTHHMNEEPLSTTASNITTTYQSIPDLPPGLHHFIINMGAPRPLEIRLVGGKEIYNTTQEEPKIFFSLDAQEANGKVLEIIRRDIGRPVPIGLEVAYPNGKTEVPPYTWFKPVVYVPTP